MWGNISGHVRQFRQNRQGDASLLEPRPRCRTADWRVVAGVVDEQLPCDAHLPREPAPGADEEVLMYAIMHMRRWR
jgi:hypothetical protein